MGKESRSNPRSLQFAGKMPSEVLLAGLDCMVRPSAAWRDAHPPIVGEVPETPGDEDMVVAIMVGIQRIEPSALLPGQPERWPQSVNAHIGQLVLQAPDGKIYPAVMTLKEFREVTPTRETGAPATPALKLDGEGSDPPWGDAS